VRGSRAEGWLPQTRSEVIVHHGVVVTSQPLAAQAGLRILMRGGNAIDAAVATAAVLSVVEPMMVGVASDLFVMVYVAKDKRLYALNASGVAPSGATVDRFRDHQAARALLAKGVDPSASRRAVKSAGHALPEDSFEAVARLAELVWATRPLRER
jgi:gamma-glutamyltranspeptidase